MALAPPYDQLPKLVPLAIVAVQAALDKLINFLMQKVNELLQTITSFSKNIKCDDPRVKQAKSLLAKIKETIDNILSVINTFSSILTIAKVVVSIAGIVLSIQLLLFVPAPPAVGQTITIQNETIASIGGALILVGVIVNKITSQLDLVSSKLGPAINSLSSVCQNELFEVNSKTQESIINDVKTELENNSTQDLLDRNLDISKINTSQYQDSINSEFYRSINVSDLDSENREQIVNDLLERQKNLLENIIEAPSKSIINKDINNSGTPNIDLGNVGDYYIDQTTKTLYGPKLTDTDWGTGLNY